MDDPTPRAAGDDRSDAASRWTRLETLFERLQGLPEPEREAVLAVECADDTGLAEEVRALLRADAVADGRLTAAVAEVRADVPGAGDPAAAGFRIGAYQVVRELGSGGMGTVYLAERVDDAYRAHVAVKLLHLSLPGSEGERRFLTERQILAHLGHPGIARLLDGGTTDSGAPYLVMEYVEGLPITTYARETGLDLDARLRLFLKVCRAVQFAHARLVVHRDLKPANIVVDADGEPKLLDFGIAKLLGDVDEALGPTVTRTGSRMMTPLYASPEQVRGGEITVATDVYALGVLLYELLTDRLPYDGDVAQPQELERAILDREPRRPSDAVTVRGPAPAEPPAPELTTARLARTLRGDLDTIVLQALQKDPSRRYTSAEAFADDIARYLDGLPVRARPDSWTYRTGKFVRRNRGMVLSGLSLLLTIAFFTVGSVVQAIQLQRERDVARRERDRAQAVADFLSEVFGASAPENALGTEPTARELLDRGAERIRADERMDPELKASLSAVIGNVYQGMGLEQQALPLFEEALATQRATRPDPDVEQVETAVNLGYSLMQLGDFDRAIPTFEQAVAWAEALPEATPRLRINAERALGIAFTRNGRYAEARVRLEEALARARAEGDTVLELSAANDVGQLEMDSGNWAEAAEIHQRVLNRREATLDPLHPNVLTSLNNLAIALEQTTRFAEAAVAYDTLLARSGRLYGPESGTHATYLNNAASFFKRAGQPERALPLQEQALDIYTVSHGDSSAYVAMAYNNLANILHDLGQTRDAAALHRRALALNLALYGEVHFRTAGSYNNLAAALRDLGDLDGAIENYRRTLDIDRRASGEDHPFTATDRVNLASALSAHGAWSEAEAQFDSAAALQDRVLEPMNTDRALRLVEEGIHAMRRGDPEVAVPLLREALRIDEAGLPPTSTQVAYARTALGAALVRTGQREEGVELLRSGYARLREAAGPQSRGALQAAAWLREAGADPR